MGRHRPWMTMMGIAAAMMIIEACGTSASSTPASSASSSMPPPGASAPATAPAATVPPATTGSPTIGSSPAGAVPTVDLTFTGTKALTAKGTGGRCVAVIYGANLTGFEFTGKDAEYPGLGLDFTAAVTDSPSVKWELDANTLYFATTKSGFTVSADRHTVSLDLDLTGAPPQSGPEHVSGTITCP